MLWKALNETEESQMRAAARKNYKPYENINGTWHPVYQMECVLMNVETMLDKVPLGELENEKLQG